MIFLFRKEIKKWNKIWWFVIASLALGSASFFFMRGPDKSSIIIALVNGKSISLKEFHQTYSEAKASLDDLAMYWGISPDRLASMMGMGNIAQSALSQCIQNVLLDDIVSEFDMYIDEKSLQDALAGTVSKRFVDRFGQINLKEYQNYLNRLNMNIADYETRKEKEFKRGMIIKCMMEGSYVSDYVIDSLSQEKNMKKSFAIITLPFDRFLEDAKKDEVSEQDLKKFFKEKQENYRVNEKRKVKYIAVEPEKYKEKVEIDEEIIENFYKKNKSTLYRIPPKIKVRVIVLTTDEHADPEVIEGVRNKANELLQKVKQAPERFDELARTHSKDPDTATKGGLTDFFQRGAYDPEFERVAFLTLKEPGDLSEVIKTKRGFEIIKLEDRIPSSEKPLSAVRDDVIESIKNKRALLVLKSDFDAVIRTARTDKEIFEKFARVNNFKVIETDWLTKDDAKGYELLDMLAQRMFSGDAKKALSYGYFVHKGKHVLYKETAKEESYIPSFNMVEIKVKEDWYERKAQEAQQKEVKKLRVELFSPGVTFDQTAQNHGFTIVTTPLVESSDKVESLKEAGNIVQEAFALTDPSQLLVHKHKREYYFVKFVESHPIQSEEPTSEKDVMLQTQKNTEKQRCLAGFIASLQRNARIDIREDILASMSSI